MPITTRYRGRKRTNYVRRSRRKPNMRRPRTKLYRAVGIPSQMFAKLRYSHTRNFSVAGLGLSVYDYNLNSLFDPDATGGGNQPYYFDQYAALYERYRVYGCKVTVMVTCSASTTNAYFPDLALLTWAGETPSWTDWSTAICSRGAIVRRIVPAQKPMYISKYYNLQRESGVSKTEYNVAEVFQALTGGTPVRRMYTELNIRNNDSGTSFSIGTVVNLTYYVKFYDRREPAQS